MEEPVINIGAVTERPGFGPGNTLIQFVDVPFTIQQTGSSGMVSIPANQFNAELAQQLVMTKAKEMWALHQAFPK